MNITLCQNMSENNIINKTIVNVTQPISCTIKGPFSVENPVLLITYNGSLQDVNYMKIPEFKRCYYITDIINLTGGRYEIRAKSDVLESFKADILKLNAIIDKQQSSKVNMFLNDGSFVNECKEFMQVLNYSSGFNTDGEYILITAGGGGGII